MQDRIKIVDDFNRDKDSSARVYITIPKKWWTSCSTIGVEEKRSKLDLIQLRSRKRIAQNPHLDNWNIINGDYMADLSLKQIRYKTIKELRLKKERIYLTLGLLAVILVVILFSALAATIG